MTVPGAQSHELPKRLQDVITPIKDLTTVHQLKQSVMQLPVVQQASQDLTQFVPDNSVSAHRMDLSWAGVSKLESVTVVRIGLRGSTGQKGALTVAFEDQNSSAQWDVPLDWQSVTTLNTRALQERLSRSSWIFVTAFFFDLRGDGFVFLLWLRMYTFV